LQRMAARLQTSKNVPKARQRSFPGGPSDQIASAFLARLLGLYI